MSWDVRELEERTAYNSLLEAINPEEGRGENIRQHLSIRIPILHLKRYHHHLVQLVERARLLQKGPDCSECCSCRLTARVAIDARAECAEGHRPTLVINRHVQARRVAAAEEALAARVIVLVVNRADRVNHLAAGQAVCIGDFGAARGAAVELAAFFEKARACGAVDSTVDAAAAEEGVVGSVDNGIDSEGGDVSADEGDAVVECLGGGRQRRRAEDGRRGVLGGVGGLEFPKFIEKREAGDVGCVDDGHFGGFCRERR